MSASKNKRRTPIAKVGARFGALTIIAEGPATKWSTWTWIVRCDCGTVKTVQHANLVYNGTRSCGCLRGKHISDAIKTHGMTNTPEFRVWSGIMARCYNRNHKDYPRYGAKGIHVAAAWHDFSAFFKDMGKRPSKAHSVDRFPDRRGNYAPGNCRWATLRQQANNTAANVYVRFRGETKTLKEWCRALGLKYHRVWARVRRYGWTYARALTEPFVEYSKRKWR
jgi:hypothetical protein